MFIKFIKEKKSVSIPALTVIPLYRYISSGYLIDLVVSFLFMLVCLFVWFLISKNDNKQEKETEVKEITEEKKNVDKNENVWTKKRKSVDDRLGTIGLLILGVISIPFGDGAFYIIFLVAGIVGITRLFGKKAEELSPKKKTIAWILAVIYVIGTGLKYSGI